MRLSSKFRAFLYTVVTLLSATGLIWLGADNQKSASDDEFWQRAAAWLLMSHGGIAMLALMCIGALVPVHALRAWRVGRNRTSGGVLVFATATLIATAFLLYYATAEVVRFAAKYSHVLIGVVWPFIVMAHIYLGRRTKE